MAVQKPEWHFSFKNIVCLGLLILSCDRNEIIEVKEPVNIYSRNSQLTEYFEDNKLLYSFRYDSNFLIENIIYSGDEVRSFYYEYDESGKPDKIKVTQPRYDYFLIPVYSDSVLSELRLIVNDKLRSRYIFEYNREGQMVRVSRISDKNIVIAETIITWENKNIREYELKFLYVTPHVIYKYEFEYDERINPYKQVFGMLNYNLIEYLPISENNWITMVAYDEEYPQTRITLHNTYAYAGQGYPFVRLQSAVDIDGKKTEIYSEYKY